MTIAMARIVIKVNVILPPYSEYHSLTGLSSLLSWYPAEHKFVANHRPHTQYDSSMNDGVPQEANPVEMRESEHHDVADDYQQVYVYHEHIQRSLPDRDQQPS